MKRIALILAGLAMLLVSCSRKPEALVIPDFSITAPPADLNLPEFYTKYTDVNGIPLISSWRVPDSCFVAAHRTLYAMTSYLAPEILQAMVDHGAKVAIMARYEGTTDIPEHAWMKADTSICMDVRARGLEGTLDCPLTTCAEENILAYQIDQYHAEDILVHEFAHAIQLIGIHSVDPTIDDTIQEMMDKAVAEGKWYNTYTIDNYQDYWAEGVQDWFNVNAEMPWHDGKHCYVNTREELKEYDRPLYDLISKYFPATDEQISKHAKVNLYTHEYPYEAAEDNVDFDIPECVITGIPDDLDIDRSFYRKCTYANGIPICSSWRVPDSCLVQAHRTIYSMTSMLPEKILKAMTDVGTRITVMARYEGTTDVPEHAMLAADTTLNWNLRARGLGGTVEDPLTSGAEENILAYQIDKYHAEDILLHEFSHAIHLIGIIQVEPDINDRLQTLLDKALAEGKYQGTYASTNFEEYWAEGVQDWFNVNGEVEHPDGKHNWVNTREDLKAYDPDLYELISQYFPATEAQISKHKKINLYTHE